MKKEHAWCNFYSNMEQIQTNFCMPEPCHWTLLKRRIISCPMMQHYFTVTPMKEFVRSYANTVGLLVMNTVKMVAFYKL